MKIGLIGAGIIGNAHARRLAALPQVDEVLVGDAQPEAAARLAGTTPKSRQLDVEAILSSGVDGVVVTAPTAYHAEWIHKALDAGVPVLSEKPVAIDVATTREVVAHAAEVPGVPVRIGFQRRFDRGYRRARELYRRGTFGFVHTLRATTLDEAAPPEAYIRSRKSGGLFKDCSIHDYDIISWLLGTRAKTVFATGSNKGEAFFRESGDVDSSSALVIYEDQTVATVSASRNSGAGHDVRLEIFGSLSGIVVGLDDRLPLRTAEERVSWLQADPYHSYNERFDAAYRAELAYFLEVARGAQQSACTPQDALEALYVAEASELSRQRGAAVELAELREAA